MSVEIDEFFEYLNPLDSVENVLCTHNWVFNRISEDELVVQIAGKACSYRLFFIWQEDMNALQFCAQYDMTVNSQNMDHAAGLLMKINENLWMGHFDIPSDTGVPSFRQTCLMRGLENAEHTKHFEDMVDIALTQCERFYSAFHFLCSANIANDQVISLALMDTSGEA